MKNNMSHLSLIFGVAGWIVFGLSTLDAKAGNSDYGRLGNWFFVVFILLVLGLITGAIALARCKSKKMALAGIVVSLLPFAILLVATVFSK